jgi:hypothetical protein
MAISDDKPLADEEPRGKKSGGERLKDLALLATSMIFALLILEALVRATGQQRDWALPMTTFQSGGILGYRLRADTTFTLHVVDGPEVEVTTNARGFRGPVVSTLAERTVRVVSIGDSFTFGWGLDLKDLGPSRFFADYAHRHPDRDVAHAYVASPGWDPKDYYFAYMTEVLPFLGDKTSENRPRVDLVVLGFFAGNDILDPTTPRLLDPKDATVQTESPPPAPQPWLRFPGWIQMQLSSSRLVMQIAMAAHYVPTEFARFNRDIEAQKPLWETTFFYLKALNDAVKRSGGRLVILSYPSNVQINAFNSLDKNGFDHTAPDRVLEAFCKEIGVDLITLLEPLKAHNEKADLYWPLDRHMTARGHEIVASVLAKRLTPIVDQIWEENTVGTHTGSSTPSPTNHR